ncbi:MAG: hypothetical protein AB7O59_05540 [Pirellulales bacterium]
MIRQPCKRASRLIAMTATFTLAVFTARGALAADRIKLAAGNQATGTITEITPTKITVELGATKRDHAVNEIDTVTFDGEPNELTQARFAIAAGRNDDALALLAKIDAKAVKREAIAEDVAFYKASAAARQALAGNGSIADAGRQLVGFEKSHKNSFHYFAACELLGELLAAVNRADQAEAYFTKLAAAPWPEYKTKAALQLGRALVSQKKYDAANARFDEVLSASGADPQMPRLKLAASLGKAAAAAGAGQHEQAVKSIEEVIAKADAEDQELYARAYNLLGNCYLAAGKKQDALLAFLHVDLLYPRFAEQHAEALANLAKLWGEVDKADRAAQAQSLLKEKYPMSTWAQK